MWIVTVEFDDDNDGVGMVVCGWFDNVQDDAPSFVHTARADTKIQEEYRKVMKEAVRLRRKKLDKIKKQNTIIEKGNLFINDFEAGFDNGNS